MILVNGCKQGMHFADVTTPTPAPAAKNTNSKARVIATDDPEMVVVVVGVGAVVLLLLLLLTATSAPVPPWVASKAMSPALLLLASTSPGQETSSSEQADSTNKHVTYSR